MQAEGQRRVRRRAIFTGRVQGVFFRATSVEIAQRFDVVGFVRNLPDGSVELEAEGPDDQVASLLAAVRDHYRGNIRDLRAHDIPLRGDERDFDVRY